MREVFTLIDAALVPRRDWLVSEGKDPVDGPVARFVSTVPKEVCRPQPDGKNYPGTLAGTRCPLLPPCQGLLPLVSWGICVAPCPRSSSPPRPPKKPQLLEETLPGPGREASASRGSLLREKQASALQAHPASQGSSQSTNHRQERTVNPWPRLAKGFPAPRSPSRAGLNGANALSWPTADPGLSF